MEITNVKWDDDTWVTLDCPEFGELVDEGKATLDSVIEYFLNLRESIEPEHRPLAKCHFSLEDFPDLKVDYTRKATPEEKAAYQIEDAAFAERQRLSDLKNLARLKRRYESAELTGDQLAILAKVL